MEANINERHRKQTFEIGLLVFALASLAFSFFDRQIEYVLDITGLTGKKPRTFLVQDDYEVAKDKKDVTSTKEPQDARVVVAYTTNPPKIDGLKDDWPRTDGLLLTNDSELSESMSTWFHQRFDDENLYLLATVRDPAPKESVVDVTEDPTKGSLIQYQVVIDQMVVLNTWNHKEKGQLLQLHFFQTKKQRKKSELFDDKDSGSRVDATEWGAKFAVRSHPDSKGYDIEIAVPWKALCLNPENRPSHFDRMSFCYGVRLSKGDAMGIIAKDDKVKRKIPTAWFMPRPSERLPLVEVAKGKTVYTTTMNEKKDGLDVNWDAPLSSEATWNQEIEVIRVDGIMIDGLLDDWPLTSGILTSESGVKLKHPPQWLHLGYDGTTLYLLAVIKDPTACLGNDRFRLRLKTDSVHSIVFENKTLSLDGKPMGKRATHRILPDGTGYVIEAALPLDSLSLTPGSSSRIPTTTDVRITDKWMLSDLSASRQDPSDDPSSWGALRFVDYVPEAPMPVNLVSGDAVPFKLFNQQPTLIGKPQKLSPAATCNARIYVLPGTATVDGQIDDWDLSGGIFCCGDVRYLAKHGACWFHLMYDKDRLYALFRFIDSTPMAHGREQVFRNDMVQLRIAAELIRHFGLLWRAQGEYSEYAIEEGTQPRLLKGYPTKENDLGLEMKFRKHEDGRGYTQELSIPWKAIRGIPDAFAAGDELPLCYEIRTVPNFRVCDMHPNPADYGNYKKPDTWGKAIFVDTGNVTPLPCRLVDGTQHPVKMIDGKPVVDWSALQK